MKKAVILGRTNWENRFYLRLKADKNIMKTVRGISESLRDSYFTDMCSEKKRITMYDDWKDVWIPINTEEFGIDIMCGDKIVHMTWYKYPNLETANNLIEKFCEWAKVQKK